MQRQNKASSANQFVCKQTCNCDTLTRAGVIGYLQKSWMLGGAVPGQNWKIARSASYKNAYKHCNKFMLLAITVEPRWYAPVFYVQNHTGPAKLPDEVCINFRLITFAFPVLVPKTTNNARPELTLCHTCLMPLYNTVHHQCCHGSSGQGEKTAHKTNKIKEKCGSTKKKIRLKEKTGEAHCTQHTGMPEQCLWVFFFFQHDKF